MTSAAEFLKSRGIQPSLQRILIAKYLRENRDHPSADEVYSHLCTGIPTLSKATVYNTLNLFSRKNVVNVIVTDDGERHYDGFTHPHAHACCPVCGHLEDVNLNSIEAAFIDRMRKKAGAEWASLILRRTCPCCMETIKNKEK